VAGQWRGPRQLPLALAVIVVVLAAAVFLLASRGGAPQETATASPAATPAPTPAQTATATEQPGGGTATETAAQPAGATETQATETPAARCEETVTLTVLTRHPSDIQEMAKDAFLKSEYAKRFCVSDIVFKALPPGFWSQVIRSSPVDVAWGGGPTLFDQLFLDGLLRPLETRYALEAAAQVPDEIAGMPTKRVKDGKIYWVGAAIASFGFTVNTEVAAQLGFPVEKLKHWRDLASDDLGLILLEYGKAPVAIANPLQSTSNTRMYEIILQAYGWDEGWKVLTLMAANAEIKEGSEDVRDAVINGEVLVGITIDFYGYTAEKVTNGVCRYILPQGETIVNADPVAVTVSTKHPEAAEAFVAWLLTEGQAIWLNPDINRLPANPKVFDMPLDVLCKVAQASCGDMKAQVELLREKFQQALHAKVIRFNDTLALETEFPMQLYFVATLRDEHKLLQDAWTRLLKAYYVDKTIDRETFEKLKNMLGETVTYKDPVTGREVKFTLEDAIRVGKLLREAMAKGDAALKDKYMNAWREAAREKYRLILDQLSQLGG